MKRTWILVLVIIAFALLIPMAAIGKDEIPGAKVTFETVNDVDGVVLDIYLKADLDLVWNLITNPDNMPYLFEKLTLHPIKGFPNRREYRLKSPFGMKKILCELEKQDNKHLLTWHKISGDFEVFYGSWQLLSDSQYAGFVHLKYRSFVDPGGMARLFLTNNRRKNRILEMSERLIKLVNRTATEQSIESVNKVPDSKAVEIQK